MKKILLAFLMLGTLVGLAPSSQASLLSVGDVVRLNNAEGYDPGGEFRLDKKNGASWTNDYFRTFCVETNEYFSFGTELRVAGISFGTVASGKSLSQGAAALYFAFRTGQMSTFTGQTYDYTPGGSAHFSDATALQQAIWHFMGWSAYSSLSGKAESYRAGIQSFLGGNGLVAATEATSYGVRVLNLVYNSDGSNAQDQLYLIPEPGSLAIWGLIGLGCTVMASRRRRLA